MNDHSKPGTTKQNPSRRDSMFIALAVGFLMSATLPVLLAAAPMTIATFGGITAGMYTFSRLTGRAFGPPRKTKSAA